MWPNSIENWYNKNACVGWCISCSLCLSIWNSTVERDTEGKQKQKCIYALISLIRARTVNEQSWIWRDGAHSALLYVISLLTAILLFWCRWIITITTIILDVPLLMSHSECHSFVSVRELDRALSSSFIQLSSFHRAVVWMNVDDKSKSDEKWS